MTRPDTAAIEARLAADTAPTWHVCDDDATQVRDVFGRLVASAEGVDEADLIAHAPTDLRALLDEVERLQRWVARLRRATDFLASIDDQEAE